jgi:hypothetical protein
MSNFNVHVYFYLYLPVHLHVQYTNYMYIYVDVDVDADVNVEIDVDFKVHFHIHSHIHVLFNAKIPYNSISKHPSPSFPHPLHGTGLLNKVDCYLIVTLDILNSAYHVRL